MKKLLKSGICGSMNSTWCTVCCRKVNICGYCSLNSIWTVTAFCQNAWKKKKKEQKRKTQTGSKRRRISKLAPALFPFTSLYFMQFHLYLQWFLLVLFYFLNFLHIDFWWPFCVSISLCCLFYIILLDF